MRIVRLPVLLSLLAFLFAVAAGPDALAQAGYPNKPIRLVVSTNPGNVADARARQIADRLGPLLGQQVIVDNRPGANGNIATEFVVRAPADGYTIFMGNIFNLTWNPHMMKMAVDPLKSLAPITLVSAGPPLLVAHPSAPFNSVGEMIAWARANPGKLNMGGGTAGLVHVVLEMIRQKTGADITLVPYKAAGGQITTDLIANQIHATFDYTVTVAPLIASGRVKAIAVASSKRLSAMPNVPTFAESGYEGGLDVPSWQGFFAPAGTPREVIARIAADTARVLAMPDIRSMFESTGAVVGGDSPEQFAAFYQAEHERWGKVIRAAGIRVD